MPRKQITVVDVSKDMVLLPAKPGTCPQCAVNHPAEFPHDKQSLFYQMKFRQENERFPTWEDAMVHCSDDMKKVWRDALTERGVALQ